MFMNIRHLGDTLFATLHNNQPNLKSGKKSHKYLRRPCPGHEKGRGRGHQDKTISAPPKICTDLMFLEASTEHRTAVTPD